MSNPISIAPCVAAAEDAEDGEEAVAEDAEGAWAAVDAALDATVDAAVDAEGALAAPGIAEAADRAAANWGAWEEVAFGAGASLSAPQAHPGKLPPCFFRALV